MTQDLPQATHPSQPWLYSGWADSLLILSPAILSTLAVLWITPSLSLVEPLPLWLWVGCVLAVDVAHVYSTLFRTYLHPTQHQEKRTLLVMIPLLCWIIGAMLYALNGAWFWTVLAYLAVFHFIRQQYGFMALYARNEPAPYRKWFPLDQAAVYAATLYPLIYWHTHLPRQFTWFIEGDFLPGLPLWLDSFGLVLYALLMLLYFTKEILLAKQFQWVNWPKNIILIGTAWSWYTGIVLFNGDLAFTLTNVLAHGIPYLSLVWLVGLQEQKKTQQLETSKSTIKTLWPSICTSALFGLLFLWTLAYVEEGLWDGLIWREHANLFPWFTVLPTIQNDQLLSILIPLLALPQSTHYVLDGFIWQRKQFE